MLKRTIEVSIPLKHAIVLSFPDPTVVLSYLQNIREHWDRSSGLFGFRLLFPSKKNGGVTDSAEVLNAIVFINGNSSIGQTTSRFEGVLHSLGDAVFETENGPQVWIDILSGTQGGECVGECMFEVSIDTLFSYVGAAKKQKAA